MTNNRFDAFESQTARPDNAYNSTPAIQNLTLEVQELWAKQPQNQGGKGEARGPNFLDCDENPLRKGCEGPGKNPIEPPKDNDKQPKSDGEKESAAKKWPPVDAAWGTPHGQGLEGREGRAGRERGNTAVSSTLQEHQESRTGKEKSPLLPELELIDLERQGPADRRNPR
jgi:hypothetical protein